VATATALLNCPYVYDGDLFQFDLDSQTSTRQMSANWYGLSAKQVVSYDVAIVSSKLATKEITDGRCRTVSGLTGLPDAAQWESTRMRALITRTDVKLTVGETYYVLLRTTLNDGTVLFSNSNGILIAPTEEPSIPVLLSTVEGQVEEAKEFSVKSEEEEEEEVEVEEIVRKKIYRKHARSYASESCSIDEANRCRQALVIDPVGKHLNDLYGPPVWIQTSQAGLLFRLPSTVEIASEIGVEGFIGVFPGKNNEPYYLTMKNSTSSSSSDDDDGGGLSSGGIVGIAVAVPIGSGLILLGILLLLLLCLLIIIILILICCVFLLKPRKFDEDIRTRTQDVVDSDLGKKTEVSMGDTNTRVEFPDLDGPS